MAPTDTSEVEVHFPWIAPLRNQLKRLSLDCNSGDYKKALKKFESSVSAEVTKLKSKPKRATKFCHILKNFITNFNLIQYVGGLTNDEDILSAFGLIVTHYINLTQSSSIMARKSVADVAKGVYSFIQIVLPQPEFILDTILVTGGVTKLSEGNPLILRLLKNSVHDRSKFNSDSKTFFKYLTMLKLLMESQILEKKIRKILIHCTIPKDFSAYLFEKLKIRRVADDVDLVYVLSRIKTSTVIEECKSKLSVRGLETAATKSEDKSSSIEFMDASSLFFIDVGSTEMQQEEVSTSDHVGTSNSPKSTSSVLANDIADDNEEPEDKEESEPDDENEQNNELCEKSENEDEPITLFQFSNYISNDEVDPDEDDENMVATDGESDEDIPLVDLESDFDEEPFSASIMKVSKQSENDKSQKKLQNDILELPAAAVVKDEGSGNESADSDDTVQLNLNKPRNRISTEKEQEGEQSESGSDNDKTLQLPNGDHDSDNNSMNSTDTVDISLSGRERPSDSPESKKTGTGESNLTDLAKAKPKENGEVSPRRTRAAAKKLETTAPDQQQSPARRTRAQMQPTVTPKEPRVGRPRNTASKTVESKVTKLISASENKSLLKDATEDVEESVSGDNDSEEETPVETSSNSTLMARFISQKHAAVAKQTKTNTPTTRRGRKSAPASIHTPGGEIPSYRADTPDKESLNKTLELPATPTRITRSTRAATASPSKPPPPVKRTRRSSAEPTSPSVPAPALNTKKFKADMVKKTTVHHIIHEEEVEETETVNSRRNGNVKPSASRASTSSQNTGERSRYNFRRPRRSK